MKQFTINVPAGKKAKWVNGVLTLVNEDITERIKTFEDACHELGYDHPFVKEWEIGKQISSPDVKAYLKLRIIVSALNEGWKPKFTTDEYRYFPWFVLYTEEEYNNLSEEDKSLVVYRSNNYAYSSGGGSYASANSDSSYAVTSIGSRLALKNKELAIYASKQFTDIYADFIFRPE